MMKVLISRGVIIMPMEVRRPFRARGSARLALASV